MKLSIIQSKQINNKMKKVKNKPNQLRKNWLMRSKKRNEKSLKKTNQKKKKEQLMNNSINIYKSIGKRKVIKRKNIQNNNQLILILIQAFNQQNLNQVKMTNSKSLLLTKKNLKVTRSLKKHQKLKILLKRSLLTLKKKTAQETFSKECQKVKMICHPI